MQALPSPRWSLALGLLLFFNVVLDVSAASDCSNFFTCASCLATKIWQEHGGIKRTRCRFDFTRNECFSKTDSNFGGPVEAPHIAIASSGETSHINSVCYQAFFEASKLDIIPTGNAATPPNAPSLIADSNGNLKFADEELNRAAGLSSADGDLIATSDSNAGREQREMEERREEERERERDRMLNVDQELPFLRERQRSFEMERANRLQMLKEDENIPSLQKDQSADQYFDALDSPVTRPALLLKPRSSLATVSRALNEMKKILVTVLEAAGMDDNSVNAILAHLDSLNVELEDQLQPLMQQRYRPSEIDRFRAVFEDHLWRMEQVELLSSKLESALSDFFVPAHYMVIKKVNVARTKFAAKLQRFQELLSRSFTVEEIASVKKEMNRAKASVVALDSYIDRLKAVTEKISNGDFEIFHAQAQTLLNTLLNDFNHALDKIYDYMSDHDPRHAYNFVDNLQIFRRDMLKTQTSLVKEFAHEMEEYEVAFQQKVITAKTLDETLARLKIFSQRLLSTQSIIRMMHRRSIFADLMA